MNHLTQLPHLGPDSDYFGAFGSGKPFVYRYALSTDAM
jgi:hypothetical protein